MQLTRCWRAWKGKPPERNRPNPHQWSQENSSNIAIRTTFLVGFGETEEEFEELCDFVKEMQFERLGVFQYSHEEDTSAYLVEDDVPADVKEEKGRSTLDGYSARHQQW